MGERTMYLTSEKAPAAISLIDQPSTWNPLLAQPHGNRVRDPQHVANIREYLETEDHPILNSVVVYPQPGAPALVFIPGDDADTGMLHLQLGTSLDVGDGQHRLQAVAEAVADFQNVAESNEVRQRIWNLDLPMLIVDDTDPQRRAQDFADLQRNAKAPSGSLGASMDRRRTINDFAMEIAKEADLFDGGARIEWQSDTVGKRSTRLYSFQAFRQAVGILLIGSGERTRAGFEAKADAALVGDKRDEAKKEVLAALNLLADTLPGFKEILVGTQDVPSFREEYIHSTAVGLYAACLAMYFNSQQGGDSGRAAQALAKVDWRRHPDGDFGTAFFDTTLVIWDQKANTRKTGAGRTAWEAAGENLYRKVVEPAQ
jgi:DGQHR domain-containing protein